MHHVWFFIGFCSLLTHEMDAVRLQEWRIHPFFSWMEEQAGYLWFTGVHVPLYAALLWAIFGTVSGGVNQTVILWLNAFFVVHVALHLLYLKHPKNEFRSLFSWSLIGGAGVCGALDPLLHH